MKRLYSIQSKVKKVIDGNTIHVDMYIFPNIVNENVKVRLEGINAEELKTKTDRAYQAKQALEALILNKEVIIEFTNTKSFDRYVGKVYLYNNEEEIDVSTYLLNNNLVDIYQK